MSIKEIKSHLTIQMVLSDYGLQLNKNQMLCCPFHSDKKASMKIYLETNTAYCFAGSCQVESLDVIDFIMSMENLSGRMTECSKHEAIQKAKSLLGKSPIKHPSPKSKIMNQPDIELLSELFIYFEKGIKHSRATSAKQYKASRGLNGKVEIGYNGGSFHNGKSEAIINRCLEAGLLKPSERGYQVWANKCLIFPLQNQSGEVVSLYGRSTLNDGHYYLQNRKGLYPCYPDPKTKRLVLTESVIDAASLLQLESIIENYTILSLYGTNGLTTEHRQAILQCLELEEIIFALDGDEAGRKATQDYTRQLKELYPHLKFTKLELPESEDINSLYVNHESEASDLFMNLFENRVEVLPVQLKEKVVATKKSSSSNGLITANSDLLIYKDGDIEILILGGIRLEGLDRLKVTLKLAYQSKTLRHNLDLYNDDQVEKFIKKVCNRLDLGSREIQNVLDKMTEALEAYRLEELDGGQPNKPQIKLLTESEKAAARQYLSSKKLMQRTMDDLGKSGIIGEEYNRLLMYIVMGSRKRDHPLHVMSLAASGQGKTHLQERVAACIPEEDKLEITTLSDNALYYFDRDELVHKLLLIEDLDGAEGSLYPLRELQSKRKLMKRVTLKDSKGKLKTKNLEVRGPVSVAGCTTREHLYEDNANRSFLLNLDTSEEQDKRIMAYQRSLSAGKINRQSEEKVRAFLQNTQRLLRNVAVRNPFAEQLQIPSSVFKPRRSNAHYLAFIEAVTFYHQYQRKVQTDPRTGERYIETNLEDIEWANKLLAPVLLRKSDELSGACRTFLEQLKSYLKSEKKQSFYGKPVRMQMRVPTTTFNRHLSDLVRYGYLKILGGNRYKKGYEYEVVNYEEYEQLKAGVKNVLDEILEKIKQNQ